MEQLEPREERIKFPYGLIAVYEHPADFQEGYVARVFRIGPGVVEPTNRYATADTFEKLKSLLPIGAIWIPRSEEDDPCVMGSYI